MSSTQQVLAGGRPAAAKAPWRPSGYRQLHGSDLIWAIAFVAPYAAVFLAFVVYPFGYALWLAGKPSLYADLIDDTRYLRDVVNTLVFVGVAVNLKMFLALVLSGFFLRRRWWIRAVLAVFVLPWLLAAVQSCIAFHWMLIGEQGLVNRVLWEALGIEGPLWFNNRWLAIGMNIIAYIWKWMPFWTVIFIAARMKISRDIYDQAEIDGATGARSFIHVTFPLLANLYLLCTLLSTLWTIGDFTTVYLVSNGGPAGATDVLGTLGFHYAFGAANPALGVAAMMTALPLLIPLVILLMRRLQTSEVQL